MRTKPLITICICLFASAYAFADGPNYQVFPQLKNLAVSYHVETKKKQTVIYATNHEKFAIICDAEMTTNKQEKTKGHETLIAPEKTTVFSFPHRSSITDVRLYLMCEASNIEQPIATEKPEAPEKPITIIEEDLEKM